MNGGVEVKIHTFLTSALDGGDWSSSRLGRLIGKETPPRGPYWRGGCMGPRACEQVCMTHNDRTGEGQ
jgi:hypothetical protein